MSFWTVLGAVLLALALVVAALLLGFGSLTAWVLKALDRRARRPYRNNPMGLLPVAERVGVLDIVELGIRTQAGKPPARPMGSTRHLSPWNDLLLNFASVHPLPTRDADPVSQRVTIGPRAERPLVIDLPVMVTAMSFGGALSLEARVALARASAGAGTATNSGEGVFIPEERREASHYIVQYHRGTWPTSPQYHRQVLQQADAIEVELTQGAQGGAPMTTQPGNIHPEMRRRFGLNEADAARIASRLEGVDDPADLIRLVQDLKRTHPVPVGIKVAASQGLERDLDVFVQAGVDFVAVDGAEGGTHGGPPILEDDMGLPTLWGLARARRYLEAHGLEDRISLVAAGGLMNPGHFLKAVALGATACYSGTALAMALFRDQLTVPVARLQPPYALDLESHPLHERLDVGRAAANVVHLFAAWSTEMELALRAMGKQSVTQLERADLVAVRRNLAEDLGIAYVADPWQPEAPATLGAQLRASPALVVH